MNAGSVFLPSWITSTSGPMLGRDQEVEIERHVALRRLEELGLALLSPAANRVHAALVAEAVEDLGEALEVDRGLEENADVHGADR